MVTMKWQYRMLHDASHSGSYLECGVTSFSVSRAFTTRRPAPKLVRNDTAKQKTGPDAVDGGKLTASSKVVGFRLCAANSRRQLLLLSVSPGFVGSLLSGTDDPTTVINSVLGAYGLPKLQGSSDFKLYDDFEDGYAFEYPRSWVGRSNSQREGIYISDFNTADKAVLEVFEKPDDGREEVQEVVRRAVSPGAEVGGDARLILPDERRIKSQIVDIEGQRYTYIRFPSETITRSGYQIKRKNLAVAATRKGRVYSLVASARSDQYNPAKEKLLQRIVDSFRLRT